MGGAAAATRSGGRSRGHAVGRAQPRPHSREGAAAATRSGAPRAVRTVAHLGEHLGRRGQQLEDPLEVAADRALHLWREVDEPVEVGAVSLEQQLLRLPLALCQVDLLERHVDAGRDEPREVGRLATRPVDATPPLARQLVQVGTHADHQLAHVRLLARVEDEIGASLAQLREPANHLEQMVDLLHLALGRRPPSDDHRAAAAELGTVAVVEYVGQRLGRRLLQIGAQRRLSGLAEARVDATAGREGHRRQLGRVAIGRAPVSAAARQLLAELLVQFRFDAFGGRVERRRAEGAALDGEHPALRFLLLGQQPVEELLHTCGRQLRASWRVVGAAAAARVAVGAAMGLAVVVAVVVAVAAVVAVGGSSGRQGAPVSRRRRPSRNRVHATSR